MTALAEIRAVAALALAEAGLPPELEERLREPDVAAIDDVERAHVMLRGLTSTLFEPAGRPAALQATDPLADWWPTPFRNPSMKRAAWDASPSREPLALLETLAPRPRVLARKLAGEVKRVMLGELRAGDPSARMLAARSVGKAELATVATDIADVATLDDDPLVRADVIVTLSTCANQKVREKVLKHVAGRIDDPSATVREAALATIAAVRLPHDVSRALRDPEKTVRLMACIAARQAPKTPALEAGIVACLRDADAGVRKAALGATTSFDVAKNGSDVDGWVTALAHAVREGPDVRHAIYALGKLGPRAAGAALDIARALSQTTNPYQACEALVAIGTLPIEAVPILEAHLRGPHSSVAQAAEQVLAKLTGSALETPLAFRLERIANELASDDAERRSSGVFAAKLLAKDAAPLLPALLAAGDRIAADASIPAKAALSLIREAMLAAGAQPDDLPRPPSRLEAYRGSTPRPVGRPDRGYVRAAVDGFVSHGAVSVPVSSLGLWDDATGKRLFVVDHAELLDLIPGRAEVAVVRTELLPTARHGGTSRADWAWLFERYAIPSGSRLASVRIPETLTHGWPSSLHLTSERATVVGGDEDEPYTFDVVMSDGELADTLPSIQPQRLSRR